MLKKLGLAMATFAFLLFIFGSWKFALLLMAAIFVHEYGHIYTMKRLGMKTQGFYFFFFGRIYQIRFRMSFFKFSFLHCVHGARGWFIACGSFYWVVEFYW